LDGRKIFGGVGNWAHGTISFKISHLPASYQAYIQFTIHGFYNFQSTDSFSVTANNFPILANGKIDPAQVQGKLVYFGIYDVGNSLNAQIKCITQKSPFEQSCAISDLFILPMKVFHH
jgi:hypothetical protein